MKKVKYINTKALVQIVESSMNGMSGLNNIVVNKMLNNYGRGGRGVVGGRGKQVLFLFNKSEFTSPCKFTLTVH